MTRWNAIILCLLLPSVAHAFGGSLSGIGEGEDPFGFCLTEGMMLVEPNWCDGSGSRSGGGSSGGSGGGGSSAGGSGGGGSLSRGGSGGRSTTGGGSSGGGGSVSRGGGSTGGSGGGTPSTGGASRTTVRGAGLNGGLSSPSLGIGSIGSLGSAGSLPGIGDNGGFGSLRNGFSGDLSRIGAGLDGSIDNLLTNQAQNGGGNGALGAYGRGQNLALYIDSLLAERGDSVGSGVSDFDTSRLIAEMLAERTSHEVQDEGGDGWDSASYIDSLLREKRARQTQHSRDGSPMQDGSGIPQGDSAGLNNVDSDGDALPDATEIRLGLNPHSADSDRDGVRDGREIGDSVNPLDENHDGVIDALDPYNDSDGDGIPNMNETAQGTDPLDSFDPPRAIDRRIALPSTGVDMEGLAAPLKYLLRLREFLGGEL